MEKFVQVLEMPKVPPELVRMALLCIRAPALQKRIAQEDGSFGFISLWDAQIPSLRLWLEQNIAPVMWHLSYFSRDMYAHKDPRTKTRMIYILEPGGENVVTRFYDEDKETLLSTELLATEEWSIMNANRYHDISGIEEGKFRYALTARIQSR